MRFVLVVIGAALAGCASAQETDEIVDPALYEKFRTSELGTDLTRGVSKKIEWQRMGTETGAIYCGGVVAVDRIDRHDVDNFFNVSVRLEEKKNSLQKLQWQIRFYSLQGETLLGFNESDSWKPMLIEPLGHTTIEESARVKGAVAFRLLVRQAGTTGPGLPDSEAGPALHDGEAGQ